MNVLFLSRFYYPHVGGVEKHVEAIAKKLAKNGCEISVVTEKHDKNLKEEENVGATKVYRFEYPKIKYFGLFFIWFWLFKNRKLIEQSDIVHCHDVFIWYLPFRFLYPNKPVYTTFHGYESYPIKKSAILVRKITEKLSWGNICIGDFIRKWYGTKPTFVSYGAVDIEKFKPSKGKNLYDAFFLSRLDVQTGILTYLDAVEEIRKKIPFKFVVLGDGVYKKQAEKTAIALGFKENPAKYVRESRFAFVSRYLAILEALASKKLVFAVYDNPIKYDYLAMAPFAKWIVIEKDPVKLAEKVLFYTKNPEKAEEMINSGYEWTRKQTWEKMEEMYLKLWQTS
jgi:glycosyltransferase involved in cell wall biosynthesis